MIKIMDVKRQFVTPAWKWLLPLLLVVAGTVVYSNSFSGVFLMDDYSAITGNLDVRHVFPLKMKWRVLTDLTFKITYAVGGVNPAYYHAGNILIHVFAGLFLYGIVRRTLLFPSLSQNFGRAAPWLAFVTAAIWIVHPIQTASVDYICQRYESMMGLFFLMTLYCFIRGVDLHARHPRFWCDLAIVACVLGMGTKEVMAMAPIILFLYDYFFAAGSFREVLRIRWRLHAAIFCTLGVLLMFILLASFGHAIGEETMFARMSPWVYLLTETEVIVHYLRLAFTPFSLCFDYSWPPVESLWKVIMPVLFMVGMLSLTIWCVWRRIASGFPMVWFFLILAPTSSFMPLGDMAFEHRMYLPLAGIIGLSVISVYWFFLRTNCDNGAGFRWKEVAGIILAVLIVIIFGILTFHRNIVYHSAETLWLDVVEKKPQNVRALTNLTIELLKLEKVADAERVSRQLLERLNVARQPDSSGYQASGMMVHYQSTVHDRLGFALLCAGKTDEAIGHFNEAVKLRPDDGITRHNLGLAFFLAGRTNQALTELEFILSRTPDRVSTLSFVAFIFAKQGNFVGAIERYRKAIEIDSSCLSAKCELAWILATCPNDSIRNGAEALNLAREVSSSTLNASYHALDVLAAAYAETGMFDEATRIAEKAKVIASTRITERKEHHGAGSMGRADDDDMMISQMGERIRCYQRQAPYRDGK